MNAETVSRRETPGKHTLSATGKPDRAALPFPVSLPRRDTAGTLRFPVTSSRVSPTAIRVSDREPLGETAVDPLDEGRL